MAISDSSLILKPGREKPVRNRHPWVFSGAIERSTGEPAPGDIVDIKRNDGAWLARAYFNPHSQITARILTWEQAEYIDETFWRKKLERSVEIRRKFRPLPETTAYRLVNAEADGLPGLIVDKYNNILVIQLLTLGIDKRKEILVKLLADKLDPDGIFERSDTAVRKKEKLPQHHGCIWGEEPLDDLIVKEDSLYFSVDIKKGHKTGFYLDQRVNRRLVTRDQLVKGRSILDAFSYTGGFGVFAARGEASKIVNVDDSSTALRLAKHNQEMNSFDRPNDEYIVGDAFQIMRQLYREGRRFDMVILDPPKFAHSKSHINSACRGYKDINLLAMKLLKSDGLLATFSCSGLINRDLFQKVLFGASVDAGREVQVLAQLSQAPDHPILLTFPESEYLKGFLCRVI
jgi:23S rRNA (cytosine1962-C5)-methyltransferase